MYKRKRVSEYKDGQEVQKWAREYGGGTDSETLTWQQIIDVQEIEIDSVPLVDLTIDIANVFTSVFRTQRIDYIRDLEKNGAGNIVFKLQGRNEPLCEIFAVTRPHEFVDELKKLARAMLSEEGAKDTMDLLKLLNNI